MVSRKISAQRVFLQGNTTSENLHFFLVKGSRHPNNKCNFSGHHLFIRDFLHDVWGARRVNANVKKSTQIGDVVHSFHGTGQSPHSTQRDEWRDVWNKRRCIKSLLTHRVCPNQTNHAVNVRHEKKCVEPLNLQELARGLQTFIYGFGFRIVLFINIKEQRKRIWGKPPKLWRLRGLVE